MNDNKLPEFVADLLKPIVDAQTIVADFNIKECQHESDGKEYISDFGQGYMDKCLKCGEFYK